MLALSTSEKSRRPLMRPRPLSNLARLNDLLSATWERNGFYADKWTSAGLSARPLSSLEELPLYPLTERGEFVADQNASPPLGFHLNCGPERILRMHRSSGRSREPLYWGDDAASWDWVIDQSRYLFRLAGVSPLNRLFFALPFGSSSSPWILYEGARSLGCGCSTSGNGDLEEESTWIRRIQPDTLVGLPRHLLELAKVMTSRRFSPATSGVRKLILTGESISDTLRASLTERWEAECFDHYGLTEAGSVAGECSAHSGGLHLVNTAYIAETVHPETGQLLAPGELGELVLTSLGRTARPLIRYRTGDLVQLDPAHSCPCGIRGGFFLGSIFSSSYSRIPGL
jgi:phenylacetate-CoA ligase